MSLVTANLFNTARRAANCTARANRLGCITSIACRLFNDGLQLGRELLQLQGHNGAH